MKYVLIGLLRVWRFAVSPLYGNVCRYYPSCSAYALRAVQYHGAAKGSWFAGRRLLRCHPWAPGGYDPVPGTPEHDEEMREQSRAAGTPRPAGTMTEGAAAASDREQHRDPSEADELAHRCGSVTNAGHEEQEKAVTVARGRGLT